MIKAIVLFLFFMIIIAVASMYLYKSVAKIINVNFTNTANSIKTNITGANEGNYTAIFLVPNIASHYFYYVPLSFSSSNVLNETCIGLEKAYYNSKNYSFLNKLLFSNNESISAVQMIANYGNKLNDAINQSNVLYKCVYEEK